MAHYARHKFLNADQEPVLTEINWRDGATLVASVHRRFPARCVKCNAPQWGEKSVIHLAWLPGYLHIAVLLGPYIYWLVSLSQRRVSLEIGLCLKHTQYFNVMRALGWAGLFVGLLVSYGVPENPYFNPDLVGFFIALVTITISLAQTRVLRASHITEDYVHLKGCGEAFLATYPSSPPPPQPAEDDLPLIEDAPVR